MSGDLALRGFGTITRATAPGDWVGGSPHPDYWGGGGSQLARRKQGETKYCHYFL